MRSDAGSDANAARHGEGKSVCSKGTEGRQTLAANAWTSPEPHLRTLCGQDSPPARPRTVFCVHLQAPGKLAPSTFRQPSAGRTRAPLSQAASAPAWPVHGRDRRLWEHRLWVPPAGPGSEPQRAGCARGGADVPTGARERDASAPTLSGTPTVLPRGLAGPQSRAWRPRSPPTSQMSRNGDRSKACSTALPLTLQTSCRPRMNCTRSPSDLHAKPAGQGHATARAPIADKAGLRATSRVPQAGREGARAGIDVCASRTARAVGSLCSAAQQTHLRSPAVGLNVMVLGLWKPLWGPIATRIGVLLV